MECLSNVKNSISCARFSVELLRLESCSRADHTGPFASKPMSYSFKRFDFFFLHFRVDVPFPSSPPRSSAPSPLPPLGFCVLPSRLLARPIALQQYGTPSSRTIRPTSPLSPSLPLSDSPLLGTRSHRALGERRTASRRRGRTGGEIWGEGGGGLSASVSWRLAEPRGWSAAEERERKAEAGRADDDG